MEHCVFYTEDIINLCKKYAVNAWVSIGDIYENIISIDQLESELLDDGYIWHTDKIREILKSFMEDIKCHKPKPIKKTVNRKYLKILTSIFENKDYKITRIPHSLTNETIGISINWLHDISPTSSWIKQNDNISVFGPLSEQWTWNKDDEYAKISILTRRIPYAHDVSVYYQTVHVDTLNKVIVHFHKDFGRRTRNTLKWKTSKYNLYLGEVDLIYVNTCLQLITQLFQLRGYKISCKHKHKTTGEFIKVKITGWKYRSKVPCLV